MPTIVPIILAGGAGARIWPLSRAHYPKQLLSLMGDHTLLENTLLRLQALTSAAPIIICQQEHRFNILDQLERCHITDVAVILEQNPRNTAPAAALAVAWCCQQGLEDALLLFTPADHWLPDTEKFIETVTKGISVAEEGELVAFGVRPTHGETGYGYINMGKAHGMEGIFEIHDFVEKPNQSTADNYFHSGHYLWNTGLLLAKTSIFLSALQEHTPSVIAAATEAVVNGSREGVFLQIDDHALEQCPTLSLDNGVMEKASGTKVVILDPPWSDLGSWHALWENQNKDEQNNVLEGDVHTEAVSHCYINAQHRLVCAVGVRHHIIVETADAVLVAHRTASQSIKTLVDKLAADHREEILHQRKVHCPWGSYETIAKGPRFQVKHITVKPQASLSLQKHLHRAEHWVIVRGSASVERGEESFTLVEDESTFIPVGTLHRLHNPGKIPLELIEIQTGSYLGEDDIERLEDRYDRIER